MHACPFCKSDKTNPMCVAYADGPRYWRYCEGCGASGPHKDSQEEADAAFTVVEPVKVKRNIFGRLLK